MTDFTQDLFARRRNASDGNTRVVSAGRLWYDSVTNTMRVSDGHTPGGQIITGQSGSYTLPTATPSVKGGVQLGANVIASGASIDVLQPTRVSQLENDSNYLSGAVLATYATQTFVTTQGYITSAALAAGNANVIAANSRITAIDANVGAYQIWANANITILSSNAGTQATSINRLDANIGAYQIWANTSIFSRDANLGTATTNITTLDANLGVRFTTLNTLHANVGAYQTWANGRVTTIDANIGTLSLGNISTQANLGAYQTFANSRITTLDANLGARFTTLNTLHANVGAYQVWANGRVTALDANLGTATTNISNLVTQANANVAAYLTTYTGNIAAGNASITSNLVVSQSGLFCGPYNESSTLSGVFVGNTGTAPGITPRVGFFNGNTQQNWQIDNNAGEFRWFVPGATRMSLYPNGNLNVVGSLTLGGKKAVNGPAFSAYANATPQTITTGSQQKVLFQTEEFDTDNCYANSRFTPNVEGYYQLNAEVRLDGVSGTGEMMIVIYKNTNEHKRGTNQQGTQIAANFWAMTVSSLVYANGTTDYFEIRVQQGSGGNVTVTTVNSPNITWFNGAMLRGA
jgi:hypothetical protein